MIHIPVVTIVKKKKRWRYSTQKTVEVRCRAVLVTMGTLCPSYTDIQEVVPHRGHKLTWQNGTRHSLYCRNLDIKLKSKIQN